MLDRIIPFTSRLLQIYDMFYEYEIISCILWESLTLLHLFYTTHTSITRHLYFLDCDSNHNQLIMNTTSKTSEEPTNVQVLRYSSMGIVALIPFFITVCTKENWNTTKKKEIWNNNLSHATYWKTTNSGHFTYMGCYHLTLSLMMGNAIVILNDQSWMKVFRRLFIIWVKQYNRYNKSYFKQVRLTFIKSVFIAEIEPTETKKKEKLLLKMIFWKIKSSIFLMMKIK